MPGAKNTEPSILGLRRIRGLDQLSDSALEELGRDCRWHRYLAGQSVISRNSSNRDVYLIVTGMVRATAFSAAGRQVT